MPRDQQKPVHTANGGPPAKAPPTSVASLGDVWSTSVAAVGAAFTKVRHAAGGDLLERARDLARRRGTLLPRREDDPYAFRRPVHPEPIEAFTIEHPDLPITLDGLTILHLTDLHIRREHRDGAWLSLLDALDRTPADLVVYTGDYHDGVGHERAACNMIGDLLNTARPRLGQFGVFGNHDTHLMRRLARRLSGITWLENRVSDNLLTSPGDNLPVRVMGLSYPEDPLAAVLDAQRRGVWKQPERGFVVTLAHMPSTTAACADIGLPFVMAGHTHAGQVRLNRTWAIHTSSDLPPHMASGVLRLRQTLCCISRGVGDGVIPGLRINCPRQVPLYTLRRGPLLSAPGSDGGQRLGVVRRW